MLEWLVVKIDELLAISLRIAAARILRTRQDCRGCSLRRQWMQRRS